MSSAPKKQESPPSETKQSSTQGDKSDSPPDDPPSLPDKPNPTPDKPNPPPPGETTKPMDSPSPPTKPKPEGSPSEKFQESLFLSELPYLSKKHANDWFATNGTVSGKRFTIYGKESPHGIFLHPKDRDFSEIYYNIGRKWTTFRSGVAVPRMRDNGEEKGIGSPLTFEVLGDEDKLWTSKPVQDFGKPQWCEVNVEKVDVLKLRVRCPGSASYARAVWFEPQVTTKSVRPDPSNIVTRLAVPDEAILKSSTEEVRNIYKVDYDAARKPGERSALAAKLFERGVRPKEDPARRFACLSQARDLAAGCGDVVLSLRAIDELSEVFTVEVLPMKVTALGSLANTLRGMDALRSLLFGQILPVLDEAEAADDYEAAAKLLAIAEKASRSSKERSVTTLISQRRTRTERLRKAYANIADAVKTLAVDLRDAEANLTVGKFECFDKEDWYKGLPMLARGSDAALAELARLDRADPTAAAAQAQLGQKWWELADKQSEPNVKSAMQRRARYWFRAALPLLEGDDKVRITSRLEKKMGNLRFIPGLVTELFAGENFEKRIKTRLDYKIDYNWGLDAPAEGVPADHFSIRWQGVLIPPRAGKYTIIISCDDDVRLLLDGKLAINYGGGVRPNNKIAEVSLSAQPHQLLLEFREATGPAYVHLSWILEGGFKEQTISLESLYHDSKQERLLAP